MTRGILVIGTESTLLNAVASETAKRMETYICAKASYNFGDTEARTAANAASSSTAGGKGEITLQWNPASPISARTIILNAENNLGRIDDAILVCSPPSIYCMPEALKPADIETLVNSHIKGWFFVIRELAQFLRRQNRGRIVMTLAENTARNKDAPCELLGTAAAASFRALATSVLSAASAEPFEVLGFSINDAGQEQAAAAWLYRVLDEDNKKNSGRWRQFGKTGFFR